MSEFGLWFLNDDVTVFEATMLALNKRPDEQDWHKVEKTVGKAPKGYETVKGAIIRGIEKGRIEGQINPNPCDEWGMPCTAHSEVNIDSLRNFFKEKNWTTSKFFFPDGDDGVSYLNPNNPKYSPKLAAAVMAWKAVSSDDRLLKNKSPKKALEIWIKNNSDEYGLLKEDGTENKQAIEEIAKIANWNIKGGATKTATHPPVASNPPTPNKTKENQWIDEEEETPFPF